MTWAAHSVTSQMGPCELSCNAHNPTELEMNFIFFIFVGNLTFFKSEISSIIIDGILYRSI